MKANQLKKVFMTTTLAAAMSVTAIAATNPAGTGNTGGTGDYRTPDFNPATGSGQDQIRKENEAAAGSSTGNDNPAAGPNPIGNPNVADSVKSCELQKTQEDALINVIEIINAQPKVDDLFNSQSEAAKGCFAASSQVINLAMEIPTFSPSWSNLGSIVKANIMKMIAAKQQELINKGCAIADQALLSAMQPIQDYMVKYTGALGGMQGNFGGLDMDAEYDETKGSLFDQVMKHTQGNIDEIQGRVKRDGEIAADISKNLEKQYEDMLAGLQTPNKTPDFNGGSTGAGNTGSTGNTNQSANNANTPSTYGFSANSRAAAPQQAPAPRVDAPAFQAPPVNNVAPPVNDARPPQTTASGTTAPNSSQKPF